MGALEESAVSIRRMPRLRRAGERLGSAEAFGPVHVYVTSQDRVDGRRERDDELVFAIS